MNNNIDKLKDIAKAFGVALEERDIEDNGKITEVVLLGVESRSLCVLFITENSKLYADDISSDALPRELYPEPLPKSVTIEQRNQEILQNIAAILSKDLQFHKQQSLFNAKSGYFLMPIDGKITRIHQKSNFFNLPLA